MIVVAASGACLQSASFCERMRKARIRPIRYYLVSVEGGAERGDVAGKAGKEPQHRMDNIEARQGNARGKLDSGSDEYTGNEKPTRGARGSD